MPYRPPVEAATGAAIDADRHRRPKRPPPIADCAGRWFSFRAMSDLRSHVETAEEAARLAVELAEGAARSGTFGVGGLLLHASGRILRREHNRVVEAGAIADPTAHAERLLIDWFFKQRGLGKPLPPPGECVIVSTLDPCIHCAAAIMATGFQAISIAPDRLAGVFTRDEFGCLPAGLRTLARRTFHRFQIEGDASADSAAARADGCGLDAAVSRDVADRAARAFGASAAATRRLVAEDRAGRAGRLDARALGGLTRAGGIVAALDEGAVSLIDRLIAMADPERDFAAFIDPRARIIVANGDRKDASPARTAVAELTRAYAAGRRRGDWALSHPRDCILLTRYGPDPGTDGLNAIGAYGSTMEASAVEVGHERWLFARARQDRTGLNEMIARLPPFYSDVVRVRPVELGGSSFRDIRGLVAFASSEPFRASGGG